MSLTLRNVKGSPLTYNEMDDNLIYLETLGGTVNSLGKVLDTGNATDGNDINITNGDKIIADDGGVIAIEASDSGTSEISRIAITPQVIAQIVDLDGTNTEYTSIGMLYNKLNITSENTTDTSGILITPEKYRFQTNNSTTTLSYSTNIGEDTTFGFDGINNLINTSLFPNPLAGHTLSPNGIETFIRINNSTKGTRIAQNSNTITLETINSGGVLGAMSITPTFRRYNEHNVSRNKQNTATTTDATTTNLTIYSPSLFFEGVFTTEFDVYGFEPVTGDAIGVKAFATFKIVGGILSQVGTTTLDIKSSFPPGVEVIVDTDGTSVRFRVQGEVGRTINWKGGYTLNN